MNDGYLIFTGAGCSVDAGLLVTHSLTTRLDELLCEPKKTRGFSSEILARYRFVCAVLAMAKARAGLSPFDGINVEEVFSAVELLAERRKLEVSPFVAQWIDGVDSLDVGLMQRQQADNILRSIGEYLSSGAKPANESWRIISDFRSSFESCVRGLASGDGLGYKDLSYWMTRLLVDALQIEDASRVDYLEPLVSAAIDLNCRAYVTLNYDLAAEMAFDGRGYAFETGIAPDGGFDVSRLDEPIQPGARAVGAPVPLLKLHGSISWTHMQSHEFRLMQIPWTGNFSQHSPMLVFGQREKLRHDGPFLDLLFAFRRALATCNRVLVVGYSFRDAHINHYLQQWLRADDSNALIVVSPTSVVQDTTFDQLCHLLTTTYADRIKHVNATAREGLIEAVGMVVSPRGSS